MNRIVRDLLDRNRSHARADERRFDAVQAGQRPDAVTVCCSDSRVLQDQMWGNEEPGRLFTCSNVGNRVVQRAASGEVVSGDVLYPIHHAGTETVLVVGHTGCGAVTATYDALTDGGVESPGIEHCIGLLKPGIERALERLPAGLDRTATINRLVERNVDRQVERLRASDDVPDSVDVLGAVYDFQDVYPGRRGEIHVINVGGETDVDALREAYPEIASRIVRLSEPDGPAIPGRGESDD